MEGNHSSLAHSSGEDEEAGSSRRQGSKSKIVKSQKNSKVTHVTVDSFIYHPDLELPDLSAYCGSFIEVKIERVYLSHRNKNVRKRRLFGRDEYTSDSDVAAILLHSGLAKAESSRRRAGDFYTAVFLVKKNKRKYEEALQNGIMSRRLSLSVDQVLRFQTVKPVSLKPIGGRGGLLRDAKNIRFPPQRKIRKRVCERELSYHERFGELVFNMNNEYAFVFNLTNICDKSDRKEDLLYSLLGDYLMVLETCDKKKFVLSSIEEEEHPEPTLRLYSVRNPFSLDNKAFSGPRIPLEQLEELDVGFAWNELEWGENSLTLRDKCLDGLSSFKFYRLPSET